MPADGEGFLLFGRFAPHGRALERVGVGMMDQAIQDGIAEGGFADDFMPVLQGELAGDQGGLPAMSILEDFEEIAALGIGEGGQAVVFEDE